MKSKEEIINEVKLQKCWRPWRGAGSAIFFELGDKLKNPKGGEPRRGVYTIGIAGCPWQIFKGGQLLFNDSPDYKQIDLLLKEFENKTLEDIKFDINLHEESIVFSDGLVIQTYHNAPDEEWHILTPEVEFVVLKDGIKISERKD